VLMVAISMKKKRLFIDFGTFHTELDIEPIEFEPSWALDDGAPVTRISGGQLKTIATLLGRVNVYKASDAQAERQPFLNYRTVDANEVRGGTLGATATARMVYNLGLKADFDQATLPAARSVLNRYQGDVDYQIKSQQLWLTVPNVSGYIDLAPDCFPREHPATTAAFKDAAAWHVKLGDLVSPLYAVSTIAERDVIVEFTPLRDGEVAQLSGPPSAVTTRGPPQATKVANSTASAGSASPNSPARPSDDDASRVSFADVDPTTTARIAMTAASPVLRGCSTIAVKYLDGKASERDFNIAVSARQLLKALNANDYAVTLRFAQTGQPMIMVEVDRPNEGTERFVIAAADESDR
jgi:hypothetical protein